MKIVVFHKCIYNLVDIFNKLKEQKDKLSDIGNGSGIDKELTLN